MNNILFPPDFLEVGNFGVLSLAESIQENNVTDMVNYVRRRYRDDAISIPEFESLMRQFQIDYHNLPQYLKDRLDTIDVY